MANGSRERGWQPRVVVPDSSVVLKWFLDETESTRARQLRDAHADGRLRLVIPDLLLYELANVLRYKPNWDVDCVGEALDALIGLDAETLTITGSLLKRAVRLAYRFDTAVYDAAFVVVAEAEDGEYVTADERFARKLRELPFVKWLRTYRFDEPPQ